MSSTTHITEPQLNATPLIDVLLVLIVMLIFTIPIATHAVKLNLPQGQPFAGQKPELVFLDIDFDGAVIWNGAPVASIEELETRLRALHAKIPTPEVHVRPDNRSRYEYAARVLAAAGRAHVRKLSIAQVAP